MGILDSNRFFVHCPECGHSEIVAVHEKGSSYGSSGWGAPPEMEQFAATWDSEGFIGPRIVKAVCRNCKCEATVEQRG